MMVMMVMSMMMVMLMVMLFVIVMVLMIVIMSATLFSMFMMMSTFRANLCRCQQLFCEIIFSFNDFQQLCSGQIIPRSGDDWRFVIKGTNQLNGFLQFVFLNILGTA